MKSSLLKIAAALFLSTNFTVDAASVSIKRNLDPNDSKQAIWIEGVIEAGDFESLKTTAQKLLVSEPYSLTIYLDSSGGDVQEAIKMGSLARELLAKTMVIGHTYFAPNSPEGKEHLENLSDTTYRDFFGHYLAVERGNKVSTPTVKCYSACVLLFWGGVKKDVKDNSWLDNTGVDIPVMGLHRAFYEKEYFKTLSPSEAYQKFEGLKDAVRLYLHRMGAPNELVERMLKTSSSNLELVTQHEFSNWFARDEPFYNEWLEARCSDIIPQGIDEFLKGESVFLQEVNQLKIEEAKRRAIINATKLDEELPDVLSGYMPPGYSLQRYNNIKLVSNHYFQKRSACLKTAASAYRLSWANKAE